MLYYANKKEIVNNNNNNDNNNNNNLTTSRYGNRTFTFPVSSFQFCALALSCTEASGSALFYFVDFLFFVLFFTSISIDNLRDRDQINIKLGTKHMI